MFEVFEAINSLVVVFADITAMTTGYQKTTYNDKNNLWMTESQRSGAVCKTGRNCVDYESIRPAINESPALKAGANHCPQSRKEFSARCSFAGAHSDGLNLKGSDRDMRL